jgi:hypothetical protein
VSFTGLYTSLVNARTHQNTSLFLELIIMANNKDLEAALLEVANSKAPNYVAIAKKHKVHRSTLSRYARGVTISRAVATRSSNRLLTDA